MRPVVSSIVVLALALVPFAAMASPEKPAHKPLAAKVMKHQSPKKTSSTRIDKTDKVEKVEKADKDKEKGAKAEKAEKPSSIVHVRHSNGRKDGKPMLHHAHGVEVGGAGHKEPKIDHGVSVIPASLKAAHPKLEKASHKPRVNEPPKLPNPNATKASKAGAEKGARKPAEKKNDDGGDKDGKPERDEQLADLVAPTVVPAGALKSCKAEAKAKPPSTKPAPCAKDPIEMIRGPEIDTFELTKCDGTIAPLALEHLSVLVRPGSAARPTTPLAELAKKKGSEIARGVHRVDERLAMRLQSLADHFGKPGHPVKLSVVSGYRPTSIGSMHATGRAIDFRVEGAKNEDVVAFCKTLTDTGCGYYPNSSFVHLDVRDPGAGHVSWIDASGPGETPRYVSTWPPPHPVRTTHEGLEPATAKESAPKLDREEAPEAVDAHPADAPAELPQ